MPSFPYRYFIRLLSAPWCAFLTCVGVAQTAPVPITVPASLHFLAQHWERNEGLPQNSVTSIVQGQDGYLWLGTFNGLVRFDGVRFKVFRYPEARGLLSNRILQVWMDSQERLWIATEGGGLSFRNRAGDFVTVTVPASGDSSYVVSICEDFEGNVWWTSSSGRLHRYRAGRVEEETSSWGLEWYFRITIAQDETGPLSIGTNQGLLVWRDGRFRIPSELQPRLTESVTILHRIPGGGLLAHCGSRVLELQKGAIHRVVDSQAKSDVSALAKDRQGRVWIGSYSNGLRVRSGTAAPVTIGRNEGLSHEVIRCLYEDREGNMWVGTYGGGLNRLQEGAFRTYIPPSGRVSDVMLSIAEAEDGSIFIGTNGDGIVRWDPDNPKAQIGVKAGLAGAHVWSVLKDRNHVVWAGTWGMGLLRAEGLEFKTVPDTEFFGDVVLASYEAPDGTLWFGGEAGLASWDGNHFQFFSKQNGLTHSDVRGMVVDKEGTLWVATNGGGLNRYKNAQWTAIRQKDGLAGDSVWSLHYDAEGILWVGTFGGGLSRIEHGVIQNFTTAEGLPENVICHINEDDMGYLWLSTYNGVCRILKSALKNHRSGQREALPWFTYGKSEGMPTRECSGGFQPSGVKLRDGRLCFPTVKGLAVVDPRRALVNSQPISVVIEETWLNGELQPVLGPRRALRVEADQKRVEFRYTALNLTAPEKVRFRYRMKGLEDHWVEAGTQRSASYSHLPAGQYVFQVIAANSDGVWNPQPTVQAVIFVPPFYQSMWFVVPAILGAVGALGFIIRAFALRHYLQRMVLLEKLNAIEQERARIAKDIHDDLGASLTQIHLLSELAHGDLGQPKVAEAHLRKISNTARALTRAMDEIVWAVNPHNDTLDSLMTYMTKHSHEYLGAAHIRCRLDIPTLLPQWPVSSETRHHLFMVLKESLNNIVKHAQPTEVWLRVTLHERAFTLAIEDNGCGMKKSHLLTNAVDRIMGGNGLGNMHQRMKEIGGVLSVESNKPKGLIVRIKMEVLPAERSAK